MNRVFFVAAVSLIAIAAPASAQSVRAGIDAWQHSDYAQAVAIWTPLATNGDADAQFNLGQAYRLGRGVPTNLATAKSWFEKAADQGHLDAETTLGLLLFQNGDQSEGLKWLKKAAVQGEPRALLMYGTALVNGDSVTQDPVLGYAYVTRAAAQGLQPAKDTLAQLDQILPLADRKRGVEIAQELAKAVPPPATAPARTAKAKSPSPKPAQPVETAAAKPKPVETAEAKADTETKPKVPAKAPPKAPAKSEAVAKSAAPASGAWRIQLGAFSKTESAEALYRKVSGKAALSGRQAFYIPVGPITRLQVGPFESSAAAEAACRSTGVACFPVRAK
jgi:TPR repeat protein